MPALGIFKILSMTSIGKYLKIRKIYASLFQLSLKENTLILVVKKEYKKRTFVRGRISYRYYRVYTGLVERIIEVKGLKNDLKKRISGTSNGNSNFEAVKRQILSVFCQKNGILHYSKQ